MSITGKHFVCKYVKNIIVINSGIPFNGHILPIALSLDFSIRQYVKTLHSCMPSLGTPKEIRKLWIVYLHHQREAYVVTI